MVKLIYLLLLLLTRFDLLDLFLTDGQLINSV